MGEGEMTDIVQQACAEEGAHSLIGERHLLIGLHGLLEQACEHQKAYVIHTQAMVKPGMDGAWVQMERRSELLDPSQFLDGGSEKDLFHGMGKPDVLPQGIADTCLLLTI